MYEGETVEGRVTVAARGISHTYTKLAELAFDSYRKCMSVIVKVTFTQLSSDKILLLLILGPGREDPRAEQGGGEHDAGCLRVGGPRLHGAAHHEPRQPRYRGVSSCSRHCILCPGLRTLVLGHKTISEEQWTAFSLALDTTNQSLVNRSHVNLSTCQHVNMSTCHHVILSS